jgi:hypothetical protein
MMKHLSVALLLSIVVCLVSASLVEDEFLAFQKKFNKQYASEAEYQARLGTFEVLYLYFILLRYISYTTIVHL